MKRYAILALVAIGTIFNAGAKDISNSGDNYSVVVTTDDFKKVSSKELTPPVVEELLKQYPTSKLGAVYKNSNGEFKLIMVLKSGTRRTVYIDSYGNWFKKN
ncbi:hypothetical protein [Maribacter sp. R77961]|uniref:hypothetical protein n=1 Tax=Maribacter sp. R77961 TaxID=3093871 RepID=UPI0037CB0EA9